MKSIPFVSAFAACISYGLSAPVSSDGNTAALVNRQTTVTVPASVTLANGQTLNFEIDPSIIFASPSGSGSSGSAMVSATFAAIASGPTGVTGEITGNGGANASLDPGSRGASTTLTGVIGPDTALTGSTSQSSNTGPGSAGAGGDINANSGAAHSGAGSGVAANQNGAGGGGGGGSDAFGTGAGGGSGANVSGNNNDIVASVFSGASPDGAFIQALTNAISQGKYAVSGTGASSDGVNDITGSFAGTGGSGSDSGAGSGAGGPNGDPGVDSGIGSSS